VESLTDGISRLEAYPRSHVFQEGRNLKSSQLDSSHDYIILIPIIREDNGPIDSIRYSGPHKSKIFSHIQKGLVAGIHECMEHEAITREIIAHTRGHRRNLFSVQVNFSNSLAGLNKCGPSVDLTSTHESAISSSPSSYSEGRVEYHDRKLPMVTSALVKSFLSHGST
jgi:hypothetical protein